MNLADYGFELVAMKKLSEGIAMFIELIADEETKKVYLNNYFEGLYITKGNSRYSVHTEMEDDCIIGNLMYETIEGISTATGENLHRLVIKNRVGNTYIENVVNINMNTVSIAFGHKKQFTFISKTRQDFYFSSCSDRLNVDNPLRDVRNIRDIRDIRDVRVLVDTDSIVINANISERLLETIEKEGINNELCLALKDLKAKKKYYFHGAEIVDGILTYELTTDEMNLLNSIETDFSAFEGIMVDVTGREYRLYVDEDSHFEDILLPTNDYHAEVVVSQDGYLQMTMMTSIFFEYTGLCHEGNGFVIDFKKRSYDLRLVSVIAQRVNTNIEFELPYEILDEDKEHISYGVRLSFDVGEADFRVGIYQLWVEFRDGLSVERYPLKFIRKNQIRENTYLTTVHPYTTIDNHYYSCIFYNDSSNNLKCNIVPKLMKIQIGAATVGKDKVTLPLTVSREPYFENISGITLCAENGDLFILEYIQESMKEKDRVRISASISLDKIIDENNNTTFIPEIRFNDREASVKLENNFYRPAVNNRETSSFQVLKKLDDGSSRQIWGNHQGAYLLGSTENCGLFKLVGMWLYEDDKLCIRIEWAEEDFANMYDDKQISLYLKNRITSKIIAFDRELAVEDEIIFRVPLSTVSMGEFLVYGQMPDGVVSYIENTFASYTLSSETISKKIVLKKENACLYISIEELLLFENTGKFAECQKIIQRAQLENAGKNRKIWLVGENYGLSARDNGLAFFEYCMSREDDIDAEVYFVTKAENKDIDALSPYKERVLIYDSMDHIYLDELAEFYIVSHGIRDVMPSLYHDSIGKYRKNVIYLQHGIIAMKICDMSNRSYGGSIRKFVVTSEQERGLLVDNHQFWEDELIVTGLARYDKLHNLEQPENYIWIMPTWRDWLVKSEKDFVNSDFYKYYSIVLEDKTLIKQLRKSGQKLIFSLHVEFEKYKCYFDKFENDVVHITDMHERSITERIKECRMIVTDYSSIIFDVVYLGKPVLFFQYDQDMYNKYRGSYVDLEMDLPGEVTHSPEDLVVSLINMIKYDFMVEPKYADRAEKYFDYHDCNNSMRIYEAIIECREEIADEY